jgi:hypothetical protein
MRFGGKAARTLPTKPVSISTPLCYISKPKQFHSGRGSQLESGDEGDRTPDLGVANAALSQLSYIPTQIFLLTNYF